MPFFVHKWQFRVRGYEVGLDGTVGARTLINYLEEVAMQGSSVYGFGFDWYAARDQFWVVRNLNMRFYEQVHREDDLEITTWISDVRRVSSHREYDARRLSDGARIMRGRHNWVYLDGKTQRPERVPVEFTSQFIQEEPLEALDLDIVEPYVLESPRVHTLERRVDYSEIDQAVRVNNAVYVDWCEQAFVSALRAIGWPPDQWQSAGFRVQRLGHQTEYLRGLLDNEPIRIITKLAEVGRDRAAWNHEIFHGETGEIVARDRHTVSFMGDSGPRPIPDALMLALQGTLDHAR